MFDLVGFDTCIDTFYLKMIENAAISDIPTEKEPWTLKDMVGHLIDSASNNHQRFVRLQIEDDLHFPGYDAETWKTVSAVKSLDYLFLVQLWKQYNRYLMHLIRNMDPACFGHCWITDDGKLTLEFLVTDYFAHLKWHEALFDDTVAGIRQTVRS